MAADRASTRIQVMSSSREESKCNPEEAGDLLVKKHVQFFKRVMNVTPPSAIAMDTNRSNYLAIL